MPKTMNEFHIFLNNAFPNPLETAPVPCAGVCAISGVSLSQGYPIKKIISKATAEVSDIFRYPSEWVSPVCAELFRASRLLRGNLLATPNGGIRPFISEASATFERPSWKQLVFELPVGMPTIAIVTDESKRRLWPYAKLSDIGKRWAVLGYGKPYPNAAPISRILHLNIEKVRKCHRLIETGLDLGIAKIVLATGIYKLPPNQLEKLGRRECVELEKELTYWRDLDEFVFSIFTGQASIKEETWTQNTLF